MNRDDFEQRFQRHVEFMLEQQARSDERLNKLEETQIKQTENINQLVRAVNVTQSQVDSLSQHVDSIVNEMRGGFNNLIVANEVTRQLTEEIARLTIQTSQRVTGLERRVTDLEQK